MDISAFEKQYGKALDMLSEAIATYDSDLWYDDVNYQYAAWHIAYHCLFFANIYCSPKEEAIVPWGKSKDDYHFLGKKPWPPFEKVKIEASFSKDDIAEFLEFVRIQIPEYLKGFSANDRCWPPWYDETQLEFQINNIRHLQHHTAELLERRNNLSIIKYLWH